MFERATRFVTEHPATAGHILMLVTAVALLAGAWGSQLIGGLVPCPFCLQQRWPWYLGGALALIMLAVPMLAAWRKWALLPQLGFLAYGIYVATTHVGVEQHWWEVPCPGASGEGAATIEDLMNGIATEQAVPCDAIQWELFGISLAGYNLIISVLVAAALVFLLLKALKK